MNYPESENSLLCMVQAYITLCSLLQTLFGAFITAVMLLILEVIRKCVGIAKAKGMKLFEKFKERKSANEVDKKGN